MQKSLKVSERRIFNVKNSLNVISKVMNRNKFNIYWGSVAVALKCWNVMWHGLNTFSNPEVYTAPVLIIILIQLNIDRYDVTTLVPPVALEN